MTKIHEMRKYEIKKEDKFFFDSNIWLFLHCSIGDYEKELIEEVSAFYEKVIKNGNPIYINSLVISEFMHRYIHIEFEAWEKGTKIIPKSKNIFMKVNENQEIFKMLNLIIKQKLIKKSEFLPDLSQEKIADLFSSDKYIKDFNDDYYCLLAEKEDFFIVTHDKDFQNKNYDIEIIMP